MWYCDSQSDNWDNYQVTTVAVVYTVWIHWKKWKLICWVGCSRVPWNFIMLLRLIHTLKLVSEFFQKFSFNIFWAMCDSGKWTPEAKPWIRKNYVYHYYSLAKIYTVLADQGICIGINSKDVRPQKANYNTRLGRIHCSGDIC